MNDKPFPWTCGDCLHKTVEPKPVDFEEEYHWHGKAYTVRIEQLEIPTCGHCGEKCYSMRVLNQIYENLRKQTGEDVKELYCMNREQLKVNRG